MSVRRFWEAAALLGALVVLVLLVERHLSRNRPSVVQIPPVAPSDSVRTEHVLRVVYIGSIRCPACQDPVHTVAALYHASPSEASEYLERGRHGWSEVSAAGGRFDHRVNQAVWQDDQWFATPTLHLERVVRHVGLDGTLVIDDPTRPGRWVGLGPLEALRQSGPMVERLQEWISS